jgi:16S rRNA A1518/A1519 N6-dimethyltransferase RsmA/KsgA/DIM1 with predicted DNA glycosylase/AP lyase activity
MARAGHWNHNVHYQPVILGAVPAGCGAALEVGCGDGLLASKLAERCAEVTAIDRDARMTALARARARKARPGRVTVIEADYLAHPVADASTPGSCPRVRRPAGRPPEVTMVCTWVTPAQLRP